MTGYRAPAGSYLDDDTIMRYAPSVFVPLKHPHRSSSYQHIPTSEVLTNLRDNGFMPVEVRQSGRVADTMGGLFARHALRFRQTEDLVVKTGDLVPELLLLNSHDGSGSYGLTAGLFRIICLNGLVAGAGDVFRVLVRHTGTDLVSRVLAGSKKIIEMTPALLKRVEALREKELTEAQRLNFAQASLRLLHSRLTLDSSNLLSPRREDDMATDAWTVMNVVQENVIRGGLRGHDRLGHIQHTSSIADVERNTYINRAIWDLAEAA